MSEWQETEFGKAPAHWEIETVGALSKIVTDGSHFSPKPRSIGKYMCSVKDMTYDRFDLSNCKLISQNDFDKLVAQGCKPERNDILISKDGANCLDIIFVFDQEEDMVLLSSIAIVRLLPDVNPKFVCYFLLSPACQYIMRNNFVSGSAIPRVVLKDFKKVSILLPPLPEQKAIASVLSSLDDKIDLLHRQNKTLEAIAETLFRQWFVESKSTQPYKIEKLVDSVSIKHSFEKDKVIFLNTSDVFDGMVLHRDYSEVSGLPGQAKKSIRKNDILFSEIRPANRRFAYIDFNADDYVVSTKLMVLRSKGVLDTSIIFLFLKQQENLDYLQMLAEGRSGTFPQITFDHLKSIEMFVPKDTSFLKELQSLFRSILLKTFSNQESCMLLEKLRDTLLPNLMSGKVKVEMD